MEWLLLDLNNSGGVRGTYWLLPHVLSNAKIQTFTLVKNLKFPASAEP